MQTFKIKKLRTIFLIYWILLAYTLAALIWWFIALNQQNAIMAKNKLEDVDMHKAGYQEQVKKIYQEEDRKTTQYLGEGIIFFFLIVAGAVSVFRAVRR